MRRFEGKTAVVLGGGGGIGAAVVRRLHEEGAKVVAVGSSETAPALAAQIGGTVSGRRCDIGDPEALAALAEECRQIHGRVDVMVNSAGTANIGQRIHEYDVDDWDRIMRVNLRGAFLAIRAFVPQMLDGKGGSIVTIGSIGGIRPVARSSAYIVSKGGVVMLTRQAAVEYLADNIRVNMVAPGPIMTPMLERAGPAVIEQMKDMVPVRRLGTVEEVAALTAFLASDEAAFTTGAIYTAAGGLEAF
jgi:NAD(P)-dependent dehydrogenase (short-subunit alcohol dehydrogenase family)